MLRRHTLSGFGATENTRHENAAQGKCRAGKCRNGKYGTKLQGWKMRDWKMWHQNAGREKCRTGKYGTRNPGLENARKVSMESEQMLYKLHKMDHRLLAQ